MVKRLLVLRHAEAAPALDGDDFARRLTSRGRRDAQRLGEMAATDDVPVPTRALVSEAARAEETFALFAEAAGWRLAPMFDPNLYQATPADVRRTLVALEDDVVLIVGHNPTLAELTAGSIADGDTAAVARVRKQFPAPCLAAILFDVASWDEIGAQGRLEHFLLPDDV